MSRDHFVALHELLPRVGQVPHDRQEQAVHQPSRGGRRHAVRAALEKLLMQFVLELRDLHAERGLHDVETLGRARDRAVLEQRDEVLDLLEVHVPWGISDANRRPHRYQTASMDRAGRLFRLAAQAPIRACSIDT